MTDGRKAEEYGVQIRIMKQPDWIGDDQIAALLHAVHRTTAQAGMFFSAGEDGAEALRKRLGDNGCFFVAVDEEDRLAGVAGIAFYPSCSGWYGKGRPCAEIKLVGVDEAYRQQGISNRLYEEVCAYGFQSVELMIMTTAENNRVVVEANSRHGWTPVDFKSFKRTNYYSVVMARWKEGCPFGRLSCRLRFLLQKMRTRLIYRADGKVRRGLSVFR